MGRDLDQISGTSMGEPRRPLGAWRAAAAALTPSRLLRFARPTLAALTLALMVSASLATTAQSQITFTFSGTPGEGKITLTFGGDSDATRTPDPATEITALICQNACEAFDFLANGTEQDTKGSFDPALTYCSVENGDDGSPLRIDFNNTKLENGIWLKALEGEVDTVAFDFGDGDVDDPDLQIDSGDTIRCFGTVTFAGIDINQVTIPSGGFEKRETTNAGLEFKYVREVLGNNPPEVPNSPITLALFRLDVGELPTPSPRTNSASA